ncbi:STAS domain-containing protein [Kitasatospora sp. NPDC056138]|uniref:STAS domain-containing protein n=1 Tax=Kitasatospora sp. NPDC056138 TaxID=3345724 RepID=UPI0035E2FA07
MPRPSPSHRHPAARPRTDQPVLGVLSLADGQLTLRLAPGLAGRTTAVLKGEIDLYGGAGLAEALARAALDCPAGLDLDLTAVRFCDCAGLEALLRAREQALNAGRTLVISTASAPVERLLTLTHSRHLLTDARPRDRPMVAGTKPTATNRPPVR